MHFPRSIILNGILTHKPSFRAATQSFLLMVTCQLTDFVSAYVCSGNACDDPLPTDGLTVLMIFLNY